MDARIKTELNKQGIMVTDVVMGGHRLHYIVHQKDGTFLYTDPFMVHSNVMFNDLEAAVHHAITVGKL